MANDAWCQFVYSHECRDPVLVTKDMYTFGRSPECDGSFAGCKFMSVNHCYIMRVQEGEVWLHDTSTNGTLVNGKKIKSQSVKLCDKDEIRLVHRKEGHYVGFVYHDLKSKNEEETPLENTEEYQDDDNDKTEKISDLQEEVAQKVIENDEKLQGKRTHCETISDGENPEPKRQHVDDCEPVAQLTKKNSLMAENLLCNICQDIFHDCVSLQPCMHSYCASCYSQWMERSHECPSCRLKVSRINRNHLVNNLVEAFLKENPDKKRSQQEIDEMNKKNKITSDMLKPPRKKHNFYDGSSGDSSDDRMSDTSESDNSSSDDDDDDDDSDVPLLSPFSGFTVPSSVAGLFGFLTHSLSNVRTEPQICRQCPGSISAASSNTPTKDTTTSASSNTPTMGTTTSANTPTTDTTTSASSNAPTMGTPTSASSNTPTMGTTTPASSNTPTTDTTTSASSNAPTTGSTTSASSNTPTTGSDSSNTADGSTPPSYVCPYNGTHMLCLCCMKYMPDRRQFSHGVPADNTLDLKQTCCVCNRAFCHLYWGCHGNCGGCLNEFKDHSFKDDMDKLINNNAHEATILKDYLTDKNIPPEEVLKKCLEKLDSKAYKAKDVLCTSSSSILCKKCALKNFQELCYQYRRDIPRDDLSGHVTSRDDCYWGKNCRTQRKPHHAARFNHICEQKRFK